MRHLRHTLSSTIDLYCPFNCGSSCCGSVLVPFISIMLPSLPATSTTTITTTATTTATTIIGHLSVPVTTTEQCRQEVMKKRRWQMNAYCIWISVIIMIVMFYLSTFTEVSYHFRIHKRNTNLFEQLVTLTNDKRNESEDENHSQHCQVLHLALVVCGGVQLSYPLSTLIKSILRYRQQAIVLHLLVDDIAMKILSLLFSTWRLPAVKVVFYNASQYLDRVSWIPNRHYSGRYSFLKLILNDILSTDVDKAVPNSIHKVAVPY
ncbi:Glycosyltransferase-like protein LARGE1 [Dirofilaria immitis]|nr:Glycosyltransferase-like protein LARGE1 [Dirofilaria immitis]